jgi:hypothetical protein
MAAKAIAAHEINGASEAFAEHVLLTEACQPSAIAKTSYTANELLDRLQFDFAPTDDSNIFQCFETRYSFIWNVVQFALEVTTQSAGRV